MRILNLGAGVQSSTIALQIAHGEIPMVDCGIFADTQAEPQKVYDWLDWLEKQLPFRVYRVSAGSLRENLLLKADSENHAKRFASVPFYTANGGLGRRQCTHEYKLAPIWKKTRELLGYKPRQRIPDNAATMLIGISWDERVRMKPSTHKWMVNTWPLIERQMTRGHCLEWMANNGYPEPPKSSCLECPFHSNHQWAEIKADPKEWETVVKVDKIIRNGGRKMIYQQYLHRELKPIDQIDFTQGDNDDLFINECEGLCGV